MSETRMRDEDTRHIAETWVRNICEGEPSDESIEAQELLAGTPVETILCITTERLVEALSNELSDAALAEPSAPKAEEAGPSTTIGVGAFSGGMHVTTVRTGLRWRVVVQPIDSEDDALDVATFICEALEDLEDANDVELIEALRKSVADTTELRELVAPPEPASHKAGGECGICLHPQSAHRAEKWGSTTACLHYECGCKAFASGDSEQEKNDG